MGNKNNHVLLKKVVVLLTIFFFANLCYAAYSISSSVINSHGTQSSNASYLNLSAGGQSVIGKSANGSYTAEVGYIYQLDLIPPAGISNLTALSGQNRGEIILKWTAPGDDGSVGNLVSNRQFQIKYSSVDISYGV